MFGRSTVLGLWTLAQTSSRGGRGDLAGPAALRSKPGFLEVE